MDVVKHAGSPVYAEHSIFIDAAAEVVWSLITDVNQWPKRFGHVKAAAIKGDFAAGNRFSWKSGGVKIISTIQEATPCHSVCWTGKAFGARAIHHWQLIPQGSQTQLKTGESFDGWLVRLMPGVFQKVLDETLIGWLGRIKELAESR